MSCNRCHMAIWIKTEDMGDTASEYDVEMGHAFDCRYYKTSDRVKADRLAEQEQPVIKQKKYKTIWKTRYYANGEERYPVLVEE